MTRMQHATESLGVQLVPAVLFGSLLAGGQLFHSILDSQFMFAALHAGAPFGYYDWLRALCWSVLGNVIGGVGLVTFLRLARVPGKIKQERAQS
jgi:formate/nitrite transporter FocA (FNT family)